MLLDKIEETDKFVINECKAFVNDAKVKVKLDLDDEKAISKDENIPLIAKYYLIIPLCVIMYHYLCFKIVLKL